MTYAAYRQRQLAHYLVFKAICRGTLRRPRECERCCITPRRKLHGHHSDYSKPLEVEWLCAKCHRKEHARLKRIADAERMRLHMIAFRAELDAELASEEEAAANGSLATSALPGLQFELTNR